MLAILAAVAVFATIVTIAMPMLARDELTSRMKSTSLERDKIRARERARLTSEAAKGPRAALRQDTSGVMRDIVEKLNLRKALADDNTFSNLKMAGYRKQSHIYVFLFFRIVLPLLLLLAATAYVFGFSGMERPFMVKVTIVLVVAYAGFYSPNLFVKNQIGKRQLSIRRAWPDALDLMLICVESGMSIEAAFRKVSVEIGIQSPALAEELVLTNAELSYLEERRKAYENLASRTGLDGVKSVTIALIQAERYGTPLGTALRVLAQENRDMRMAEAEKKAAALPPKLTVPMILFFLPVLFRRDHGPGIHPDFRKDRLVTRAKRVAPGQAVVQTFLRKLTEDPAMAYLYLPLGTGVVRALQAGGLDAYGLPPERLISDGRGNPCRHCLQDIKAGEGMLTLSLRPFTKLHPYAETGPVFLHADSCEAHDCTGGVPPIVSCRRQLLVKGYDVNERIVYGTGAIVDCARMDEHLERLFASGEVSFADIRSASKNCYFCRAVRA